MYTFPQLLSNKSITVSQKNKGKNKHTTRKDLHDFYISCKGYTFVNMCVVNTRRDI